jgi:alkaline phosphatase D
MKAILLFALSFGLYAAIAQVNPLPARPGVRSWLAPFYHGVASGDPLADRVIIWTRVTTAAASPVSVSWAMATDTLFTHIVNSGTVTTDSNSDFTVKVDVTGLSANTWYYYRFKSGADYSVTGRTRTLPVGNTDSLRFAVYSCSQFQAGYFNAYRDIARRNDLAAIVHLGDYYYEYMAGGGDYAGDTSRMAALTHDAVSLSDYRMLESQNKLDSDLAAVHQQYPAIQIWDDHEVANNSWYSSAQNHSWSTQGNYFVRKNAAKRAYFEWNAIRELAPGAGQ